MKTRGEEQMKEKQSQKDEAKGGERVRETGRKTLCCTEKHDS